MASYFPDLGKAFLGWTSEKPAAKAARDLAHEQRKVDKLSEQLATATENVANAETESAAEIAALTKRALTAVELEKAVAKVFPDGVPPARPFRRVLGQTFVAVYRNERAQAEALAARSSPRQSVAASAQLAAHEDDSTSDDSSDGSSDGSGAPAHDVSNFLDQARVAASALLKPEPKVNPRGASLTVCGGVRRLSPTAGSCRARPLHAPSLSPPIARAHPLQARRTWPSSRRRSRCMWTV